MAVLLYPLALYSSFPAVFLARNRKALAIFIECTVQYSTVLTSTTIPGTTLLKNEALREILATDALFRVITTSKCAILIFQGFLVAFI